MYRHDELLFHRGSVHQVLEFQRGALQRHIDGLTSIIVLKEPSADLERELLARFTINIPKILEGDIFVSPPREVEIQRQDYGRTFNQKINEVDFTVPFEGDREAFFVQPTTFSLAGTRAAVEQKELKFKILSQDIASMKETFSQALQHVKNSLQQLEKTFPNSTPNSHHR